MHILNITPALNKTIKLGQKPAGSDWATSDIFCENKKDHQSGKEGDLHLHVKLFSSVMTYFGFDISGRFFILKLFTFTLIIIPEDNI